MDDGVVVDSVVIVLLLVDVCDSLLILVPVSTAELVAVVVIEYELDKLLRGNAEKDELGEILIITLLDREL